MGVKESLERQKILATETYLYLKRDFKKYIFNAVGIWFWIFKFNLEKGDPYRSTYYFLRNTDDVLDIDRDVNVNPLEYAEALKESIQNNSYDLDKYPILRPAHHSLQYLEKVKKRRSAERRNDSVA